MNLLEALKIVHRHGFPLIGQLAAPGGGETIYEMTPKEAFELATDKEAFASKHFDCSEAEYGEWLFYDGAPRCAAKTTAGILCKNQVSPGQLPMREFLALHRSEYCNAHN